MTNTTRLYKSSDTLGQLSTSISGDEAGLGPLQAIGHTSTASAATFERGPAPDAGVVLIDVAAPAPAGATKVCDGYVWNAGLPAHVTAYRPAAAPEDDD
jgi:hypothetical protein